MSSGLDRLDCRGVGRGSDLDPLHSYTSLHERSSPKAPLQQLLQLSHFSMENNSLTFLSVYREYIFKLTHLNLGFLQGKLAYSLFVRFPTMESTQWAHARTTSLNAMA